MKFAIVFVTIFAVAFAAPTDQDTQVLRYDADVRPDGYQFDFALSDGQQREEKGELKNVGTDDEAISVRGSFSYVGADGQTYAVNYVADENGFQPQGAHLPMAPPLPVQ